MARNIFLIRLKISSYKFERLQQFLKWTKGDYCLCKSYFAADYIITELKSPTRIVRNVKESTCPVVHIDWLIESLRSKKILEMKKYTIDVSAVRCKDTPLPLKPLPKQMTWSQLADKHNKDGNSNTQCTAASEKRAYYAHKRGHRKSKNRTAKSRDAQAVKIQCMKTPKEESILKEEGTLKEVCIKQEPVAEECGSNFFLNISCSASSLDFEHQSYNLVDIYNK